MICLNCSEYNNTLFQGNKCVENCSKGYVNISSYISACAKCFDLNRTFEFNGHCVEACPYNSMFYYNDKFCYLCDEGLFYDLKKSDMSKMNIEAENNSSNTNTQENKKKDSSYKEISTEVVSKEQKDNKENQTVIVIES